MDKKEQFLARLRQTFELEAAEHLDAIESGLVKLETADEQARISLTEGIFREAHSLKGAARAVNLSQVERLCQELESVFSAAKKGELVVASEHIDRLDPVLDFLRELCRATTSRSDEEVDKLTRQMLDTLKSLQAGQPERQPEMPDKTPSANPEERAESKPDPTTVVPDLAKNTVRVSAEKLEEIALEIEQLIVAKQGAHRLARELQGLSARLGSSSQLQDLVTQMTSLARKQARTLATTANRLLEESRDLLLLPCSYLLAAIPAQARRIAREQNKEIELQIEGEDVEIDRRVLDLLRDPLNHMLRNAIDHGIEEPDRRRRIGKSERGQLRITVKVLPGRQVLLTVSDDGAGIDFDAVQKAAERLGLRSSEQKTDPLVESNLLFESGVSTSAIITELSGRGLGLAIVRERLDKLGGDITVSSTHGEGTTFQLRLPVTQAAFRGVFVKEAGQDFVLPTAGVATIGRLRPSDIKTAENRLVARLNGQPVSVVSLREVMSLSSGARRADSVHWPVVVMRSGERQIAFLVDSVEGEREVLVKSLGTQLLHVLHIADATISDDGKVVPILNVAELMETATTSGMPSEVVADTEPQDRGRILIAEDSITSRSLLKNVLESAGYEVLATVDGRDALTTLKTKSVDLVVSDVDMPRMNGFELTSRIRADEKLREIPVILVTALESREDKEYGIEVGADAYMVKSNFDQSDLLEIVERLL